ncbi:MAG: lysine--tRNA ligase [Puniceicoccales bacterium]|jgi:lysyl-tRNA synthetase class 2|nr:lysine--tRNA ligase [Puniceicoccales bacterium]
MVKLEEKKIDRSDVHAVRVAKLEDMRRNGFDPFEQNFPKKHTSEEAKRLYVEGSENQKMVDVAGRIVTFRLMGKASFVKILDSDGQIQLYVSTNDIGDEQYKSFSKFDIGDIVGASGELFKTKTGEITVRAKSILMVAKSLRPLPEKWHGLVDSDQVYRQRYLDLIINQESRDRAKKRCQIVKEIRRFLWDKGFEEMETPILQNIVGGAAARPFETFMNALNQKCYLRIATELFLKRMLVAGFDKVFEIGRIFRNEGLSRKHNPEFTSIEIYQAFSDYRGMMTLVREILQHLCQTVIGTTTITSHDGTTIELGGKWAERRYEDLIIEATGDADWFSFPKERKLKRCKDLAIEVNSNIEDFEITNDVYSKIAEPKLIQPTFVTHLPKELCPLAKINKADNRYLDVFELCINGQEIAPAYSEQNDPFVQREMFERQIGEEKHNLDNEFLLSLEYGMPPAGGMGIGIDRLVILLTGAASIRDTILFPMLRPQEGS